jgi:subtilase family protein
VGKPKLWILAVTCAGAIAGTAHGLTPGDPEAGHPTYRALNLPAAWEVTTGSPDVVVAIADSGVDPSHPDLAGAVGAGHDFVDDDDDATDPPGAHGTAVAGVAAARANNGFGGVGVCFGCHLMPLRVLGLDGIAFNVDTADAIDYAVHHGAAVVNVSIYGPNSPERLRDAVVRARAAGVLVVAAAGNEGSSDPQYPAAFPEVISVGAAAADGRLTSYSSFGGWLKFAAPECAPITAIGGESAIGCATSVSSPLVAGIVALLRAHAPFASADELEGALAATARPIPGTRHGLVDAAAALTRLGRPAPRLSPVVVGAPVVGEELEALSGIWSGAGLTVRHEWERCRESCDPIPGATASHYTPSAGDEGYALRIAMSAPGTGEAVSPETKVVAARPVSLERPTIVGRARVGTRLVARRGTWAGTSLEFSLSWLRCRRGCSPAKAGTTYRVRPRDRGFRLRVEVVGSNSLGSVSALSKPTDVVR